MFFQLPNQLFICLHYRLIHNAALPIREIDAAMRTPLVIYPATSLNKQVGDYMRLDNLQLACVQHSTSFQIQPLRLCMFLSTSFGDNCSNYLWREIPKTGQTGQTLSIAPLNLSAHGFSFVFHGKAKRKQQGILLGQTGQTDMIDI